MARLEASIGLIALAGLGAYLLFSSSAQASARGDSGDPNAPGPVPDMTADPSVNADNPDAYPADQLTPSPALVSWLQAKESLLTTKTDLGD